MYPTIRNFLIMILTLNNTEKVAQNNPPKVHAIQKLYHCYVGFVVFVVLLRLFLTETFVTEAITDDKCIDLILIEYAYPAFQRHNTSDVRELSD